LARIHVPSKEFKKLKIDQIVTLILDSNQQRLQGRIKLISPVIDPSSGTIKVTVEVPDYPPNTRPGDFAEVQIVTEKRTDSILIPKVAVFSDKGEDVVYVAKENVAERRVIEVGFRDNDNAEIITGISIGDLVVVKGQRSLKNGDPLKILGAEESETAAMAQSGDS
jgi:membrane fusion protein (multidrug efflux system)